MQSRVESRSRNEICHGVCKLCFWDGTAQRSHLILPAGVGVGALSLLLLEELEGVGICDKLEATGICQYTRI